MKPLPIKDTKPTKVGNSFYFLVPKVYINNGIIDVNKKYDLDIIEK